MYPVSQRWREAIARPHKRIVRVNVCKFDGTVLKTLTSVVDGSVDIDETRQVRRTLSLTIESEGHNIDNLIPRIKTDLLHPASGHELRVERGIDYQDGTVEWVPLGVFRLTKPVVSEKTKSSGDVSIEIKVNGMDRSAWISRISWETPYIIKAGTDLRTAVITAIESRVGANVLKYRMPNTAIGPNPITVQKIVWGLTTVNANDPWKDIFNLVAAHGYELFFDVRGVLVMKTVLGSETTLIPNAAHFEEGPTCTVTNLEMTLDETQEYNGVIVIARGKGRKVKPVRAEVWDDDPNSPTWYLGSWGKVPYVFVTHAFPIPGQSNASAVAQGRLVGRSHLQRLLQSMNQITLMAVPNAMLQEGDVFTLHRSQFGITSGSKYVISQMTIPLDTKTEMKITNRPKRGL